MPPTKVSVIPSTARVQSVDRVSSAPAGDSVGTTKPIRSTSTKCLPVPSPAADTVDCEDTLLVDDAMLCNFDRQMSQDSILSVGQTHAIVHSTPCDRSGLDVAPIKCATFKQK